MADYIDKSKIVFRNLWDYDETGTGICIKAATADEIYAVPPADVRPVRRGRWILDSDPGEPWKYRCGLCGETTTSTCMGEPRYNFCPMCGADMRGGDAE